jgi:beta-lactamase superfamily II metal-dependent hydrolase
MRWLAVLLLSTALANAAPQGKLRITFIDVEGGQATLFVTPKGESLLVDAGWSGFNGRDAQRIVAAARSYGLPRIDYVLVTHYHIDHVGGVPALAGAFPIGTVLDHGPNVETDAGAQALNEAYEHLFKTGIKHHTVRPGDVLPIEGAKFTIVASNGAVSRESLPGGGKPNKYCGADPRRADDPSENARSIGFVMTFGKFRVVDLGDLTWNKELDLMCPNNPLGKPDLLIVSHHGWKESNSPTLVHGLAPRVAIMDNGARKGGSPAVFQVLESSPGLEDLWQLHYSIEGGAKANPPADRIANIDEHCAGVPLTVEASSDASFSVTNPRTGTSKPYWVD